jgi:hypothetical protein
VLVLRIKTTEETMLLDPLPRSSPPIVDYADKLFPKALLKIMAETIGGRWRLPSNPEETMDRLLLDWFDKNVSDHEQYIRDLVKAVNDCRCMPIVLARLNVEALTQPDLGDTVTICRKPRFNLLGGMSTRFKLGEDGLPILDADGMPMVEPLPEITDGADLYDEKYTIVKRAGRPGLSENAKSMVLQLLRKSGHSIAQDRDVAWIQLERLFRQSSPQDNILARISFLIAFARLRTFDARNFVTALLPAR